MNDDNDDLRWAAAQGCASGLMVAVMATIVVICILAG